jgi:hypothetical protein
MLVGWLKMTVIVVKDDRMIIAMLRQVAALK